MTQDPNDEASFNVHSGEIVTVTVDSIKTNCLTAAAFNGTAVTKASSNPDKYTFPVSGASGQEFVFACVCTFAAADPPDACYTIAVSSFGSSFTLTPVYKESPEASFTLFFTVS